MSQLTLNGVSVPQLVAMGDGLMRAGQWPAAKGLYDIALKRVAVEDRQRVRTRLGLASSPTSRTPQTFEILMGLEDAKIRGSFAAEGLATWQKTLPFEDDERFQALATAHTALTPLANWHWNLNTVLWAVQAARNVPGDFVELGVFKGHTTLFCAEYVKFKDWPRRWWLYDTFDGIPEDQQSPGWAEMNELLYRGSFSHAEVAARFAHIPNIEVIEGRVPEILSERAPEKIAFMHIDLNNAPAEIAALDLLFDRLSPGGVIVFDDYLWAASRVQYDAEKAWFEARGLSVLGLPTGQGLFVKPALDGSPQS